MQRIKKTTNGLNFFLCKSHLLLSFSTDFFFFKSMGCYLVFHLLLPLPSKEGMPYAMQAIGAQSNGHLHLPQPDQLRLGHLKWTRSLDGPSKTTSTANQPGTQTWAEYPSLAFSLSEPSPLTPWEPLQLLALSTHFFPQPMSATSYLQAGGADRLLGEQTGRPLEGKGLLSGQQTHCQGKRQAVGGADLLSGSGPAIRGKDQLSGEQTHCWGGRPAVGHFGSCSSGQKLCLRDGRASSEPILPPPSGPVEHTTRTFLQKDLRLLEALSVFP